NRWTPCRGRYISPSDSMPELSACPFRARFLAGSRRSALRAEELPVPLGDDFDVAVGHLDGSLVVDRVRRRRYPRGPLFCDGPVLVIGVVHVRNNRKINQSDSLSLDQDHAEFAIGCTEHDIFRRERFTAAATRFPVSLGKGGGCCD